MTRRNPQDPAPSETGSPPFARVGATSEPVAALWGAPGADPRAALLATLVQAEISTAAASDFDAAVIAYEAADKLLALMPAGNPSIAAARHAHAAVRALLDAILRASPRRPK